MVEANKCFELQEFTESTVFALDEIFDTVGAVALPSRGDKLFNYSPRALK